MSIVSTIKPLVVKALKELYPGDPKSADSLPDRFREDDLTVSITKPEFEGDYTLVLFSFVKQLKKSPEQLGKEIGELLLKNNPELFTSYNVIKGFLNLVIADRYWLDFLQSNYSNRSPGVRPSVNKTIIVEYSSPNTNKPLHLGHLRNNFLGWSVAEILKVTGHKVIKTAIMNDRGIHICKSMVAWQRFGNGATPDSTGIKGDHFVGDYYVLFGTELKKEVETLMATGTTKDEAEKNAPLMQAAQKMLVDWENGDPEVRALWEKMNGWVYEGFN
ncbi:MAG: arginine--tRNA ligase, partial [Chitinophagales bacterium]